MPSLSRARIAYAIWLFGIFAYFVPAATWNPVSRFALVRAIVESHTLTIDDFADSTGDRALRDGHWYSDKAPVPALLAVVPYAILHVAQTARHRAPEFQATGTPETPAQRVTVNAAFSQGLYVCSAFTVVAAASMLGLALFEVLRRRASIGIAFGTATATVLATPILPYATSFYGHVVAAAFLFVAFALLFDRDEPSTKRVRWAGACIVLTAGSEYIVAVPAALLAIGFLIHAPPDRRLVAVRDLVIGGLAPAIVLAAYHTRCFGAPWKTGYSFIARQEFASGHATGLLGVKLPTLRALFGILFDLDRGLFVLAPFLAAAAIGGIVVIARRRDAFRLAALAVVIALLVLNGGYYMWWGGASAGPRHLVPALPFMGMGAAAALNHRFTRFPTIALAVLSGANMLAFASVGIEAPERGNLLLDYAWLHVLHGRIAHLSGASNLGIELGLAPAASLGPLFAWLLVGARMVWRELSDLREPA